MTMRVGFLINARVPSPAALLRRMPPQSLFLGWDDASSPMGMMRFRWIADELRARNEDYELYVPGRKYAAVVFVKSMTDECIALARRLRSNGTKIIFDANVDYYSTPSALNVPEELVPTGDQRRQAVAMTSGADLVMASSSRLASICSGFNGRSRWVPDNVLMSLVPPSSGSWSGHGRLPLWWSGMAQKTADFLAIAPVLRSFAGRICLNLVTGDLEKALNIMPRARAVALRSLLAEVPHRLIRFRSVRKLLATYAAEPGVIVSPRFLDSPYNLSHSEWKITLGMACGLPAIASPQPSYLDVWQRCRDPLALSLCANDEEWSSALDHALSGRLAGASWVAREVVATHYSTEAVASLHLASVKEALSL